jgi:histidinol-phosphate phosphatase family protein
MTDARPATSRQARNSHGTPRPAVFLDRDGTLIQHVQDIRNPDDVVLVPHAANAVRYINYALVPVVVVTNQDGIARGQVSAAEYGSVEERLDDLLSERNAWIEATYHCPHHPDITGPCDCRKPGTGLFERAISELVLDASRCVYIGDRLEDIAPAERLGGRGILVPSPQTPDGEIEHAKAHLEMAPTLTDAVHALLGLPHPDPSA